MFDTLWSGTQHATPSVDRHVSFPAGQGTRGGRAEPGQDSQPCHSFPTGALLRWAQTLPVQSTENRHHGRNISLRNTARDWLLLLSIIARGRPAVTASRAVRHRRATRGMSLAAAARAGVMAAAPGLPEIGERSPEAGAGLAASEVASSALRSLAVLAGQVSAGRAEGGPGAGSAVGSLLPCSPLWSSISAFPSPRDSSGVA